MRRDHTNRAFNLLARVEVIWLAISVLACTLALVVVLLSQAGHSTCVQVQAIKSQIELSLHRSLASLPKIQYYRSHPAELDEALRDTSDSIDQFQPKSCG